jgi:hypothetical protein
MTKINTLLARIEKKLAAQPELVLVTGKSASRGEGGSAYEQASKRVMWEEIQASNSDMPPPDIKKIVAALSARHKVGQAFGPIENAALTFMARLTGSEGLVRTVVIGECSFLFPSVSFDGSKKGLRCWLGINWQSFPSTLRAELLEEKVLDFHAVELPGTKGGWPKQFQVTGTICFQLELRAAEPVGADTVQKALQSLYAQFHSQGNPASEPLLLQPAAFRVLSTEIQ